MKRTKSVAELVYQIRRYPEINLSKTELKRIDRHLFMVDIQDYVDAFHKRKNYAGKHGSKTTNKHS